MLREFLFREKCNAACIGGTNHTISDSIDIGEYVAFSKYVNGA